MLVPTLPELFVMGFYMENPSLEWGLLLLAVVVLAELTGNGILYLYVRRFRLPRLFERAMQKWVGFLMVHDERIILVNRVAPILPFVGAFIATMKWKPRRAFFYIFLGGAIKYSILIALVGVLYQVFDGTTARNATVALIGAIIIVSFIQSHLARKKHLGPLAARVAHISERSVEVAPAGAAKGEEDAPHGAGDKEQPEPGA